MNMLIFQLSHTISPIYLHSAYKITCHLGQWKKVDGPANASEAEDPEWKDGERYPKGTIVRWNNQRWKAIGKFVNAARPGHRRENSFYKIFGPSLFLYIFMVCQNMPVPSVNRHLDLLPSDNSVLPVGAYARCSVRSTDRHLLRAVLRLLEPLPPRQKLHHHRKVLPAQLTALL